MELSRKGREEIWSVLVAKGVDSGNKGNYTGRDPPWVVSSSSHIWGATALGSDRGKMSSFGWLEGCGKPELCS